MGEAKKCLSKDNLFLEPNSQCSGDSTGVCPGFREGDGGDWRSSGWTERVEDLRAQDQVLQIDSFTPHAIQWVGTIITPAVQVRKLNHREVKLPHS